jgi:hypothetical protein
MNISKKDRKSYIYTVNFMFDKMFGKSKSIEYTFKDNINLYFNPTNDEYKILYVDALLAIMKKFKLVMWNNLYSSKVKIWEKVKYTLLAKKENVVKTEFFMREWIKLVSNVCAEHEK